LKLLRPICASLGARATLQEVDTADHSFHVLKSSGKADAADWLRRVGAATVIGRGALDEQPERTLGPTRWAGAVDCVGGRTLASVLRTLRYGAAVAASGLTGGAELTTTVYPFIVRNVALLGVDTTETPADRRIEVWGRLGGDLRPGDVDALLARTVTLDGVAAALTQILAVEVQGRILVDVAASTRPARR